MTNIRLIREHRGYRQWEVAKEVGISDSHYSRIESGRIEPGAHLLEQLARFFGVDADELQKPVPLPRLHSRISCSRQDIAEKR